MNDEPKGMEVKLGEKTFYFRPPSPKDFRELEQRIVERRKSPLDIICAKIDKIPVHLQQAMIEKALENEPKFADYVSQQEFQQYLDTRDGTAYYWWLMVRENHPEIKLEDVDSIIKDMTEDEFNKVLSQRDELLVPDE